MQGLAAMKSIPELLERIRKPGCEYRGLPFWAWNGKLEPGECRRQVGIFADMGFGGFFMHARSGLATRFLGRKWFDCVRASMDEAERRGMHAWMYDEDRYPSGSAGGTVTQDRRFRSRHLAFEPVDADSVAAAMRRSGTLAWFAERIQAEGGADQAVRRIDSYRRLSGPRDALQSGETLVRHFVEIDSDSPWFNGQTYLDTMNPAAVQAFVEKAYEPYMRELGTDFGTKIPGCFTDEPCFPGLRPWTGSFRRTFLQRHGYDIVDCLPELWSQMAGEAWSKVRHDYIDTATCLFVKAYAKTIGRWCEKHGLLFTGHVLEEDTVARQTIRVGSAMRFYEQMQAPGIDQLCEIWNIYASAKQCASVARQKGREFRIAECYGVTGWDFPLEGHKAIGDWLFALGINHRCQHLAWYSMGGSSKRDYPASIFRQSPWAHRYKAVENYFARLGEAMDGGVEVRHLLLVSSLESAWGFHLGIWTPEITQLDREQSSDLGALLGAHIDFDYGEEDIMARLGRVVRRRGAPTLAVGKARYKAVLLPALKTIRKSTLSLLSKFAEAGGKVFYLGDPPFLSSGASSGAPGAAYSAFTAVTRENMVEAIAPSARTVSFAQDGAECDGVLIHLRAFKGDGLGLFVCNTSCEMPNAEATILAPRVRERMLEYPKAMVRVSSPRRKRRVFELDPETGAISAVAFKHKNGAFEFAAPLARLQSRFFFICRECIADAPASPRRQTSTRSIRIPESDLRYRLHEPNAIVLDGAVWSVNGGEEHDEMQILDIDEALRKDFLGCAPRSFRAIQPWCAQEKSDGKTVNVRLRYRFNWRGPDNAHPRLAIEHPRAFAVSLNGVPIPQAHADGSWWVDPCLEQVDIPQAAIKRGANELVLECAAYGESHPGLEAIFLLGEFAVAPDGRTAIPMPATLKRGDLCAQGFPNYSGNISFFFRPRVATSGPCRLEASDWHGAALGFRLNGGQEIFRPWPPYEAVYDEELRRDGSDEIEVILYGHRRNAFGPFYVKGGVASPEWCGPNEIRSTVEFPKKVLVPFGL